MDMYNPPHLGEAILDLCIKPSGLSVGEAAKKLGVAKKELDDFVNCRASITADLALRLEKVFGSTAELWYQMQVAYDLFHAKQAKKPSPTKTSLPRQPVPKPQLARQQARRLVARTLW